jgi:hypothetical protein
MEIFESSFEQTSKEWWKSRRKKYNSGLVIAGLLAFVCYVIIGANFIMPFDDQFEITLFTTVFQGVGYLIMIGIANLFYNLGYRVDLKYNEKNSATFRTRLFNIGYWFSFGLPFLIPILLLLRYLINFRR